MMNEKIDWKINKHVIIPEGIKLTERMFQYNNIVETITLPDNITFLPDYFCCDCKNLKAVLGGHNVKIISHYSFRNCRELYHFDFIPQIGYPVYDKFSKKYSLNVVRELKINDLIDEYLIKKKQFGYVLHKQKNEYLIWNLTEKKYVYAISNTPIPLYSYVEFFSKFSIAYDTDKTQLNIERNLVYDVNLANNEDAEKFIYTDDAKAYINGCFSYIKKISAMNKIVLNYVNSLNIEEIIESYKVSTEEYILTKVGGDDTYILEEDAHSNANPSDVYLGKLLPSYSKKTRESGYCTFSYMTEKEEELYKEKEKSIKLDAKRKYSKEEHVASLIDAYIKYLYHKTNIYQEVLEAANFLNKNREYIRSSMAWDSDYSFYWDNISNFTLKLNNKFNLHF